MVISSSSTRVIIGRSLSLCDTNEGKVVTEMVAVLETNDITVLVSALNIHDRFFSSRQPQTIHMDQEHRESFR